MAAPPAPPSVTDIAHLRELLKVAGYVESDDAMLARFLVAHHHPPAASHHLIAHYAWREKECRGWPGAIFGIDELKPCPALCTAFVHGFDKQGRPVIYIRSSHHDKHVDRDAFHKYVVTIIEEAVARAETAKTSQFSVVIDMSHFGYKNLDHGAVASLLHTLKNNYPERMAQLYIFNEGWLFWVVWKVIELLLDARIRSKIHFLGADSKKLLEVISHEHLPTWIGGKSSYEFSPREMEDYVAVRGPCWGKVVERVLAGAKH